MEFAPQGRASARGTLGAAAGYFSMPQYTVEYRERPEGALLKSSFVTAPNAEAAETEVKRAFTAVQANLGARQYQCSGMPTHRLHSS